MRDSLDDGTGREPRAIKEEQQEHRRHDRMPLVTGSAAPRAGTRAANSTVDSKATR